MGDMADFSMQLGGWPRHPDDEYEDLLNGFYGDEFDRNYNGVREISCNRCGETNVYWKKIDNKWKLIDREDGIIHVCQSATSALDSFMNGFKKRNIPVKKFKINDIEKGIVAVMPNEIAGIFNADVENQVVIQLRSGVVYQMTGTVGDLLAKVDEARKG